MRIRMPQVVGLSLAIIAPGFGSWGQNKIANGQATHKASHSFDFGPGKAVPGHIQVLDDQIYTKERGYGFEPGAKISCVDRGGANPLRRDFCTSDKPFFFSVAVPDGNYLVTLTLGDAQGESTTTVKAELRRLVLEKEHTSAGGFVTRSFVVNIRTPKIRGRGEVRLKDREKTMEFWAWDEKLTLEFNNVQPAIAALTITRAENIPTVYLLGDSTVCDQPREPYSSWGQMLTRFFKPGIAVAKVIIPRLCASWRWKKESH